MTSRTTGAQPSSRWIPWALCSIFAAFLLANGIMIYFAVASWTGVGTENAYERGLAYNQTLDAVRAQEALGWQVEAELQPLGDGEARGFRGAFVEAGSGMRNNPRTCHGERYRALGMGLRVNGCDVIGRD